MNRHLAVLAAALLLLSPMAAANAAPAESAAKPATLDDFLRLDRFQQVKISPKGTYVAATVPVDDKTVLVILKPGQAKPMAHFNMRGKTHVIDFWWVNDDRVLFALGEKQGGLDKPQSLGEIWGMNADGTKETMLVGGAARATSLITGADSVSARTNSARKEAVFAVMEDTLLNDDQFVLVSVYRPGSPITTLERMNVDTGARSQVARAPMKYAGFYTDHAGHVRFAFGESETNRSRLYFRANDDADWSVLNDAADSGIDLTPMGFSADDRIAYLRKGMPKGPDAVMAYDIGTGKMTEVSRDERFDPAGLVYAVGGLAPIGVVYLTPTPKVVYFDPESADARLHRAVSSAFPGEWVSLRGLATPNGDVLMQVMSDRNPGDFYLFNTKSKNAALFISRRDWIDPARMATTQGFHFQARDGLRIDGLLTLPPGSDGKRLPVVVNPHGGPFGISDGWGFGNERQLLANAGYAVLQVNFRGSGGFGESFERAGYKQWGRAMQDDLTDATRWAIQQGIADPNRICIYGASYGGYASLEGVTKEPDLYRCAIGYVGVYDMPMMYHDGDIPERLFGRNFLKETLGEENLDAISPDMHADRIRVPVFLAAGGEDQRAPIEQSKRMEQALRRAGKSVETLYYPEEAHGFYTPEHNREFYSRVLAFLKANIGPGVGPGLAPSSGAATPAKPN